MRIKLVLVLSLLAAIAALAAPGSAAAVGATPVVDPTAVSFQRQDVDAGAQQNSVAVSFTGAGSITISNVAISGANADQFGFTPCLNTTLLSDLDRCNIGVTFDPTAAGSFSASLDITTSAGPLNVPLTGTGTDLDLDAPSYDLGSQSVDAGATFPQLLTVTNHGTAAATITGVGSSGTNAADFEVTDGDCIGTLAAGDDCAIYVAFNPSATGPRAGEVNVYSSDAASIKAPVTGTGTRPSIARTPSSLSFGSRDIGAGPTLLQSVVVTNTGDAPLTVLAGMLNGADKSQFSVVDAVCTAAPLAAGASCSMSVIYDPTTVGAHTATLDIASNAPVAPAAVTLTGTGTTTTTTTTTSDPTPTPCSFTMLPGCDTDDKIVGTAGADTLYGGKGKDGIDGKGGNDKLYGGEGVDSLFGGPGKDIVNGEAGNDVIVASTEDTIDPGAGSDTVTFTGGAVAFTAKIVDSAGLDTITIGSKAKPLKAGKTVTTNTGSVACKLGKDVVTYYIASATSAAAKTYTPAQLTAAFKLRASCTVRVIRVKA